MGGGEEWREWGVREGEGVGEDEEWREWEGCGGSGEDGRGGSGVM